MKQSAAAASLQSDFVRLCKYSDPSQVEVCASSAGVAPTVLTLPPSVNETLPLTVPLP